MVKILKMCSLLVGIGDYKIYNNERVNAPSSRVSMPCLRPSWEVEHQSKILKTCTSFSSPSKGERKCGKGAKYQILRGVWSVPVSKGINSVRNGTPLKKEKNNNNNNTRSSIISTIILPRNAKFPGIFLPIQGKSIPEFHPIRLH